MFCREHLWKGKSDKAKGATVSIEEKKRKGEQKIQNDYLHRSWPEENSGIADGRRAGDLQRGLHRLWQESGRDDNNKGEKDKWQPWSPFQNDSILQLFPHTKSLLPSSTQNSHKDIMDLPELWPFLYSCHANQALKREEGSFKHDSLAARPFPRNQIHFPNGLDQHKRPLSGENINGSRPLSHYSSLTWFLLFKMPLLPLILINTIK